MAARFLPLLVALCALGGCFTPDYHCRIICAPPGSSQVCPANFHCEVKGTERLCARDDITRSCFADATDGGAPDLGPPPPDGSLDVSSPDTPAPGENPSELCYAGSCLPLSAEMRQTLVLWLDPSNLPAKDMSVARWPDRSREGNDAIPVPLRTPPRSRGDGLDLSAQNSGPLFIVNDSSLDLASGDFTIVVVARLMATPPSCLLSKAAFDRTNPRGVVMAWSYSTELMRTTYRASLNGITLGAKSENPGDFAPHLFVLRREGDVAEARIDGRRTDVAPVARTESVSTDENVLLGSCGEAAPPIAVVHAAMVFRGGIPVNDLARLEGYLMGSFSGP